MSPIAFIGAGIAIVLTIYLLLNCIWGNDSQPSRFDDMLAEQKRKEEELVKLEKRRRFYALEEQVDHLAKVQMLILKDMKKEHRVEPAKDVLVTVSPLSELKKGRSA